MNATRATYVDRPASCVLYGLYRPWTLVVLKQRLSLDYQLLSVVNKVVIRKISLFYNIKRQASYI